MRLLAALLVTPLLLGAAPMAAGQSAEFVVLRGGTPIGTHRVEVETAGDETRVHVSIALDVAFGPIPLYRYRHDSQEIWRESRLIKLDSRTDDDGDILTLSVRSIPAGLRVEGSKGVFTAPADTVPTSYWNPALAANRPLLDSQIGRLLDVVRVPLGPGRWRLEGELNLDIAYSPQGRWSGLSFRHKGADFVYVARTLADNRP
jgi:hypothetical protein